MAAQRETIRLPLQAGDVVLFRTAVTLVVAIALSAIVLAVSEQKSGVAMFTVEMVFVIALMVFGWGLAYRASDVAITNDDLTIEGGPSDATIFLWQEIDCKACHIGKGNNPGNQDAREHLWIVERDGREFPIGNARGTKSRSALDLLAQIIASSPSWREGVSVEGGHDATKRATTVLSCSACGGVLRPSSEVKTCPYCGAPVTIPPELVVRIDEVRKVRDGQSHLDGLVGRLLALPSARRANVLLVIASVIMFGGIPTAVFAADTPSVSAVAAGASIVAFLVAWMHVVDRQALRVLMTAFAASAPRKPGEPDRCRRCDAPLPAPTGDSAMVRCVYCGADNVLGLDVGIRNELRRESTDLESALAFRARRKNAARVAAMVTALATIVMLVLAVRST